jgi:hypothetical protein
MKRILKLRAKHGYWDITKYPIGGNFYRAGADGLIIGNVTEITPCKSCNATGTTSDGRAVAFDTSHCEE